MKVSIITLFPEVFEPILNTSILKRAQKKGLIEYELVNLRPFGEGVHKQVDDKPYGGGVGLIFKADILAKAINSIVDKQSLQSIDLRKSKSADRSMTSDRDTSKMGGPTVILTSASGTPYKQQQAWELSKLEHIIIICGHYEGIDQRLIDKYVDLEFSVGDFVLTGGEIPAMAIVDSITRLIPGVLEKSEATEKESFEGNLLEHPHYTRPEEFEGEKVPEVLISGHHQKVEEWRQEKALEKTKKIRPDLLKSKSLT